MRSSNSGKHSGFGPMRIVLALIAALLLPGIARAVTYANVATTFSWIDSSTHTKVGYNTAPYKFNGTLGSTCGTAPPTLDDTISDQIPLGFTFMYGGMNFDAVRIMSNGRLQFASTVAPVSDNTTCGYGSPVTQLPYPNGSLNYTMRIYGNDLDPTAKSEVPAYNTTCLDRTTCYVSYAALGTAPYRSFVVTWNNVPEWASGGSTSGNYNLQIILQENGEFIYQYGANTAGPGNTTAQVGWQVNSTTDYDVPAVGYPASNSAIKFYIPRPVAEYRMEQPSWNGTAGEVFDTSGNGRHGVAVGDAQTAAAGKVCRGGGIPSNTNTSIDAIDTGIGIPATVGGVGTITFWFKPNAWTGSGVQSNQLFDATIANNEWFFLTKRRIDNSNARLRFSVRDSGGATRTVETGNLTSATLSAGWVHIAVSWNFNALSAANSDTLRIYVNGSLSSTSAFTSSGTVSAGIGTLYVGDNRSTNIEGNGTARSANGTIDEFRIYNYEGGTALVQRDMNQAGACVGHYAIGHGGSGNTCTASQVTVTAHAADHSSVLMPNNTTMITLSTSTGRGDWSLVSGYGTLSNGTADDGQATYVFNGEYQAVLGLTHTTAGTVNINITDGQITEGTGSEDADLTLTSCAATTALNACEVKNPRCTPGASNYDRLYTKLAATGFSLDFVALKADGTLETNFTGTTTVSLLANTSATSVSAPTYCPASQTATVSLGNVTFSGGRAQKAVVSNAFSGVSPNYSAYRDVRVKFVCDSTNCPPSGITVCSTDNFAVRPTDLAVASTMTNTAQTGTPKLAAGADFTLTATAVPGYNGTPSVDGTLAGQKVTTHVGAADYSDRLRDSAGSTTVSLGAATVGTGEASNTSVRYHDVGNFRITAGGLSDSGFTGVDTAGTDCVAGSASNADNDGDSANGLLYGCKVANQSDTGLFGRFFPDHYTLTGTLTPGCAAGNSTYFGQVLGGNHVAYTLQAESAAGLVTTRYTNGYGTVGGISVVAVNGTSNTLLSTAFGPAAPGTAAWSNGAYSFTTTTNPFPRNNPPAGPFDAFYLAVGVTLANGTGSADPDGATMNGADFAYAPPAANVVDCVAGCTHRKLTGVPTAMRHGRLWLGNAFGSDQAGLSIPYEFQYWNGNAFVRNAADSCSGFAAANIGLGNYLGGITGTNMGIAKFTVGANAGGGGSIAVAGPGAEVAGSVDLAVNLGATGAPTDCRGIGGGTATATAWLAGKWCGAAYDRNPNARATFGVFGSSLRRGPLYIRENY